MTFSWREFIGYAFPPIVILNMVIQKVIQDQAIVILIAPFWPHRAWFSTLLHRLVHPPVLLQDRKDLLCQKGVFHHNPKFFNLAVWMISGKDLEVEEFRMRLSQQYLMPDLKEHKQSTLYNENPLVAGVVEGISIPFLHL